MKSEDGKSLYGIGLDMSELEAGRAQALSMFNDISSQAKQSSDLISDSLGEAVGSIQSGLSEINPDFGERIEAEIEKNVSALKGLESEISNVENALSSSFSTAEIEKNQAELDQLNEKAEILNATIASLQGTQQQYNNEVSQTTDNQSSLSDSFREVTDSINPMDDVMNKLPAPLQKVFKGLQGMTGASKAFIAVPMIAVISAIVLGITALTKWFKSSAEGQMAFAKISGYVSGILGQLQEIVLSVGKAIYEAFTNPQEAVKKLWETIKTNIVNRIEGLGDVFKALGKIISSGFTSGYNDLGDAFLKATTGVEDLAGKTKGYIQNLKDAGKATSDLKVAEEQLHRDRSNWAVKEAQLDSEIALATNRMMSGSNNEERKKAALEMEALVEQKYQKQAEFAKEELRITEEMNALTTNAQADFDKENQLRADLQNIETKRTRELMRSQRVLGAINRQGEKGIEIVDKQVQALEEYATALENIEKEAREAEYEADKASLSSKKDLIDKEYNYELALIQRNKEQFINSFEGIDVDTSSFDVLMAILLEKKAKSEQDLLNESIKGFETAEQIRGEIIQRYAEKRKELVKLNASEANLEVVNKKEMEELAQFDDLMQEKSSIIATMFGDMSQKSIEELKKIREEAKRLQDFLAGGEWDEDQGAIFGITKEQFQDLISDPAKLERFGKGIKDIEKSIFDLDKPINQIKEGLKELFDPKNSDTNKQLQALDKIQQGYGKYADAIGTVSGAIGALGDLAGSSTLSSIADGLNDVLAVADEAMAGAQAGAMFGPVGAVVGGVIGAIKGIATVFSANKKHREELKKQVAENQKAEYFGQLEIEQVWRRKYEWSKKIGEATLNHIKREGEELKKQSVDNEKAQANLWAKLRKEQYKSGEHFKKTGLFGWGKGKIVEEWSSLGSKSWEQIEEMASRGTLSEEGMRYYEALKSAKEEGQDLEQMQIQYLEKLKEVYTGTTYDSLVSGIISAFQQGKRSASDFADSFEKLLEGAVISSLQLLADEQTRSWYEDFAEKGKDGFTQEELDSLRADWIKLNENLVKQAEALEEATGVVIGGETSKQQGIASVGAYDKVTQDQWSETDGLFRGMHLVSLESNDHLKSISGWTENINDMRNIALESWSELVNINKNTKLLNDTNEILSDMKRNGVKML